MPNFNTSIASLMSSVSHPLRIQNYIMFLVFIVLVFIIFSQRLFGIQTPYYLLVAAIIITITMSFVICSIISTDTKIADNQYLQFINSVFDNPGSRNFLAIVSLILFVIFVYELTDYDNNSRQAIIDTITFGNNRYISNRTFGLLLIVFFSVFVAYSVMTTTKELQADVISSMDMHLLSQMSPI